MPLLVEKFERNLARRYPPRRVRSIVDVCLDYRHLLEMPVIDLTDLFAID
jgi:2-methylcitrate dehydratase